MLRSLCYFGMATKLFTMDYSTTKLVVILGSTATGKTKLSVELAKLLDGEIISADSMQVYKGLDIITNKVTTEEKQQITHHMIDIIHPTEEFTVIDFKQRALDTISDLVDREKVPIIVGGTNYFIESLLWDFLIEEGLESADIKKELQNRKEFVYSNEKRKRECDSPEDVKESLSLYEQLKAVDPERANQLHPNNVRKVSRSLQIYHLTGQTHSSLMEKQQEQSGSSQLSGPLRFPKSLILWLTADQEILDKRISSRVDEMVHNGLVKEIRTFYEDHIKVIENAESADKSEGSSTADIENEQPSADPNQLIKSYQEGLFQAIGFKEFDPYLTYSGDDEAEKKKLLETSLERLKLITIRYSKKQIRWVQNRFLGRPSENSLPIYNLDATNVDNWNTNVLEKAKEISLSFMNDKEIQLEAYKHVTNQDEIDKHRRHVCKDCNDRIIIGDNAWAIHRKSRRHKKMKASRTKRLKVTTFETS